jgi:uncharacterized cupredoxin-like copper-binding protein
VQLEHASYSVATTVAGRSRTAVQAARPPTTFTTSSAPTAITTRFGVVLILALVVFVYATDANAAKKPKNITVKLQEFTLTPLPSAEVKAGTVRMKAANKGTLTHEMVLVRAASVAALPTVTTGGGERKIGAVDEEVIREQDKMGETGDVKPGKAVTKTFELRPGHYVMFCNLDDASGNHFVEGMSSSFVVTK